MNEVLKTIAERSSIRAYTNQPLTEEEVTTLATAALYAPTARNMREVHVSVVDRNNPILSEIDKECKLMYIGTPIDDAVKQTIENFPNNVYYSAPTVFVLSADKDFKWSKLDAGLAAQNIVLAAQSMGLGSLIIGIIDDAMHGEKETYFAKKLKFPENYEFAIAVAVGHKNTEKAPHEIDFEQSVSFVGVRRG